ncbi:hypothetical protein AUJ68_00930 [Candidatus Woesearchaeota archaeon CG1_02_57_44]|nr:MAG: hypothetical protein AUJ68_00930 [Candidatus Woesearchaeota archaeon CG1_02_57_44]
MYCTFGAPLALEGMHAAAMRDAVGAIQTVTATDLLAWCLQETPMDGGDLAASIYETDLYLQKRGIATSSHCTSSALTIQRALQTGLHHAVRRRDGRYHVMNIGSVVFYQNRVEHLFDAQYPTDHDRKRGTLVPAPLTSLFARNSSPSPAI